MIKIYKLYNSKKEVFVKDEKGKNIKDEKGEDLKYTEYKYSDEYLKNTQFTVIEKDYEKNTIKVEVF